MVLSTVSATGGSAGYGQNGGEMFVHVRTLRQRLACNFGSIAHRDQIAVLIKHTTSRIQNPPVSERNNQLCNNAVLMCCVQMTRLTACRHTSRNSDGSAYCLVGQRTATVAHGHMSQATGFTIWRGCLELNFWHPYRRITVLNFALWYSWRLIVRINGVMTSPSCCRRCGKYPLESPE